MEPNDFAHYVFVDFENVPHVDLSTMEGKSVKVMLLIGKNQKKLDLALVQQALRYAACVTLTEVGASGHNALDLTLGYYLGQAVALAPGAQFHIVSNDRDFDPLIAHLKAQKVRIHRHGQFSAQIFAPPAKKTAPARPAAPAIKASPPVDKFAKLEARLKNPASSRPKSLAGLLAHVSTAYGNKLGDAELQGIVDELIQHGTLSIEDKGKVRY